MKSIITFLIGLTIGAQVFAQTNVPQGINYQAVARDTEGQLVANQGIAIKFSLLDNQSNLVYDETHSTTTNSLGSFTLEIGQGNASTGVFLEIDWSQNDLQLNVELDLAGGTSFTLVSELPLWAVPYALHAQTAENVNDTNELLIGAVLNGSNLEITDAGGTLTVDLSSLMSGAFTTIENVTSNSAGDLKLDDFVFGSNQLDNDGNPLHRTRMLFDKSIGAFRVGRASASEWDEAKRGSFSVAMGYNSEASGIRSFAVGSSPEAKGDHSVAIGSGASSFGDNSVAFGNTTTLGYEAYSFGSFSQAGGRNSMVLGFNSSTSGDYAFALGSHLTAPSYGELTVGFRSTQYIPVSDSEYVETDRLFTIGNGFDNLNPSDALLMLKNGDTDINGNFVANSLGVDEQFVLPTSDGNTGQVMVTDGAGVLSWTNTLDPSQIQVDDADANPINEIQDLNLDGSILTITNNANATPIDLGQLSGVNTDGQSLTFDGSELLISNGNSVHLSVFQVDEPGDTNTGLTTSATGAETVNRGLLSSATGVGIQNIGVRSDTEGATVNQAFFGVASGAGDVNYGIYAKASGATTNYAGFFDGNVTVTGATNLTTATVAGDLDVSGVINLDNEEFNVFIGRNVGNPDNGYENIAIGDRAGQNNTGDFNIMVGFEAGKFNTGLDNVFVGNGAGIQNTGHDNSFFGEGAGFHNMAGSENTYIGNFAGWNNITGSNNVFLGSLAGGNELGSQKLYIDNSDTSEPLIYGEFDTDIIKLNATVNVRDVLHLDPQNSAPANPNKGDIYFDDNDNTLKVWDGTVWQNCF